MNTTSDSANNAVCNTPALPEKAYIERLHELYLFTPTLRDDEATAPINKLVRLPGRQLRQYIVGEHEQEVYRYYPAIIDPDDSPWVLGNRYLLSKVTNYIPTKCRTLESIAYDLCDFRSWCLTESVDYLTSRGRFRVRPTYRYSLYLHDEIRNLKIRTGTASRRLGSVINFYRWLLAEGYEFEQPLWREKSREVSYSDKTGFRRFKPVTTTDLLKYFRVPKQSDDYSDYINDGGKLRPLSIKQQLALVVALRDAENTEMLLGFQFALATGARIQTVFTLRCQQFTTEPPESESSIRINIGHGTLVDNKNGKQMVLQIPVSLYRNIRTYLCSDRAIKRRELSKHQFTDSDHEYAFLTRNGRAYYLHSLDENIKLYRSPAAGNSVRKFIQQSLLPKLLEIDEPFAFRFHDLRATFGMNLLQAETPLNFDSNNAQTSEAPLFKKLLYVSSRMGHNNISTTEQYLNYGEKHALALRIQDDYESRLEALL